VASKTKRPASPKRRAARLEAELEDLIDRGEFTLRGGWGYLTLGPENRPCGCVLGGVSLALAGSIRNATVDGHGREACIGVIERTGLASREECLLLEQGYEWGRCGRVTEEQDSSPFFAAGVRLRARPDANPSWSPK